MTFSTPAVRWLLFKNAECFHLSLVSQVHHDLCESCWMRHFKTMPLFWHKGRLLTVPRASWCLCCSFIFQLHKDKWLLDEDDAPVRAKKLENEPKSTFTLFHWLISLLIWVLWWYFWKQVLCLCQMCLRDECLSQGQKCNFVERKFHRAFSLKSLQLMQNACIKG